MYRNLACPGAYHAAQAMDDGVRRSSIYAAEGTLAHSLAEVCVQTGKTMDYFVGQKRHADGFDFEITDDFADHAQVYVDVLTGLRAMGFAVALENVVTPQTHWDGLAPLSALPIIKANGNTIPGGPMHLFGTADCIAYDATNRRVIIADLKFGAGIPVNAEGNPQLLYYGAGAICEDVLRSICTQSGMPYNGVDTVELIVVQPRAYHPLGPIRRAEYTADFVREWARTDLYDAVKAAINDKGQTRNAGDHCRFCPALPHCDAPRELALATARTAFANAPMTNLPVVPKNASAAQTLPFVTLSDAELGELLDKISIIKPWLDALHGLALDRLKSGTPIPGWDRVPTRSTRKWADEDTDAILAALSGTPLTPDQYLAPNKPLSPTQVEKRVGASIYRQHIAGLVVKNSSGTTLAPAGDPRARVKGRTAQEAFAFTRST